MEPTGKPPTGRGKENEQHSSTADCMMSIRSDSSYVDFNSVGTHSGMKASNFYFPTLNFWMTGQARI
jgi:hypothetical protein